MDFDRLFVCGVLYLNVTQSSLVKLEKNIFFSLFDVFQVIANNVTQALLRFYEEFKTCNVPHSYKFTDEDGSEIALGRWLEHQRRCKKLKTLSLDHDKKLQQLVDDKKLYWDIYEADRKFRQWQDHYNLLVAYGELNGTCDIPENAIVTT